MELLGSRMYRRSGKIQLRGVGRGGFGACQDERKPYIKMNVEGSMVEDAQRGHGQKQ